MFFNDDGTDQQEGRDCDPDDTLFRAFLAVLVLVMMLVCHNLNDLRRQMYPDLPATRLQSRLMFTKFVSP